MAHRIIGYYTLEQLNKILNKTVYMYYKSQYMYSAKITEITSVESDARFAFAIFSQRRGGSNNTEDFYFALITSARNSFNLKYEVVQYYDDYPYGNFTDPPKSPSASWENVVSFGEDSQTVTPVSQSSQFYPYTVVTFARTAVYYNDGAQRYTDSDGCLMIIDNNHILNDWDLSVSGTTANEISYVRSIMGSPAVLPSGSGEVTLKLKAPGQTLTFTSTLLGSVVNQYISGDAVVNMEGEPPAVEEWEILWVVNAFGMQEVMLIDYNFNCTHLSGFSNDVTGQLLKFDAQRQIVVANSECTASFDDADNSNHSGQPMTNTTYQANADIAQVGQSTTGTRFALFVLAKKNASARIPYELGFYWYFRDSAEACVVKVNESMYLKHTDPVAGDKLAISADSNGKKISVQSPFSGKIKNADSHVTDYWREISGMSSDTMSGQFGIALAIPQ